MYCLAKISLFLMKDNNLKEFILKRSLIMITGNPKVALRIVKRDGQLQRKCTLSSGSKWHLGQISEVVFFILNKNEYRGALLDRMLLSLWRSAVDIFVIGWIHSCGGRQRAYVVYWRKVMLRMMLYFGRKTNF